MSGYEPRFDRDYMFGLQGELLVEDVLDQVARGHARVEVKRSRFYDTTLYVELEQNAHRRGRWKPSGLRVTDSEYWAFVKPGGVFTLVPVALLTRAVEERLLRGQSLVTGGDDGDNPTRGLLIPLDALIRLAQDSPPQTPLFDYEAE